MFDLKYAMLMLTNASLKVDLSIIGDPKGLCTVSATWKLRRDEADET